MVIKGTGTCLILVILHSAALLGAPVAYGTPQRPQPRVEPRPSGAPPKLPPLPDGVAELKFNEFFVMPVGPRGLELTDKLRSLDKRKVRMLGYMVQEEHAPRGRFIFAPFPAQIHNHDNYLAEDLPPSVVHVQMPYLCDQPVSYTPGLMLLTGTLSVGSQPEVNGRVSMVRLTLDPPKKKVSRFQSPKNLN
jgi:hypothetical protein